MNDNTLAREEYIPRHEHRKTVSNDYTARNYTVTTANQKNKKKLAQISEQKQNEIKDHAQLHRHLIYKSKYNAYIYI